VATNLLIVNPRKHHRSQLRQMLRAFVSPAVENCPAEYRQRLGISSD